MSDGHFHAALAPRLPVNEDENALFYLSLLQCDLQEPLPALDAWIRSLELEKGASSDVWLVPELPQRREQHSHLDHAAGCVVLCVRSEEQEGAGGARGVGPCVAVSATSVRFCFEGPSQRCTVHSWPEMRLRLGTVKGGAAAMTPSSRGHGPGGTAPLTEAGRDMARSDGGAAGSGREVLPDIGGFGGDSALEGVRGLVLQRPQPHRCADVTGRLSALGHVGRFVVVVVADEVGGRLFGVLDLENGVVEQV